MYVPSKETPYRKMPWIEFLEVLRRAKKATLSNNKIAMPKFKRVYQELLQEAHYRYNLTDESAITAILPTYVGAEVFSKRFLDHANMSFVRMRVVSIGKQIVDEDKNVQDLPHVLLETLDKHGRSRHHVHEFKLVLPDDLAADIMRGF